METVSYTHLDVYKRQVMEHAAALELFQKPLHPYTKALLKSIPRLDKEVDMLHSIKGSVPSPYDMPKGCKFCDRCECAVEKCRDQEPELIDVGGHKVRCWLYEDSAKGGAKDE